MRVSIHDGVLVGYTVNFSRQKLLLNIETVENDVVTVIFENYLAHSFEHVMAESILFDIEEGDLNLFLSENKQQFESHYLYRWPIEYDDVNLYSVNTDGRL